MIKSVKSNIMWQQIHLNIHNINKAYLNAATWYLETCQ